MPLLRKKPFDRKKPPKNLHDDDEVFYCELTDEVFTEYDEFCERIIQCNSLVWSCAMTGKSELTYTEALESEQEAQEILATFPLELNVPTVYLASIAQRSSFNHLVEELYLYMKDRYFIGERVEACIDDCAWIDSKVLHVYGPESKKDDSDSSLKSIPHANLYTYDVKGRETSEVYKVEALQIRRAKGVFTKDKLRLFLRQYAVLDSRNVWVIQGPVLQTFGIQCVKFHHIFTGNPPSFPISPKRSARAPVKSNNVGQDASSHLKKEKSVVKKEKPVVKKARQENIEKYFSKSRADSAKRTPEKLLQGKGRDSDLNYAQKQLARKVREKYIEAGNKKRLVQQKRPYRRGRKSMQEGKQKLKEEKKSKAHLEKLKRDEERAKLKEEKVQLAKFMKEWKRQREDLECEDLKDLPKPMEIKCRIPHEWFGEFVMILEFFHSFGSALNVKNFFSTGVSFELLERALVEKELAGPLSDIIQMLLISLFKMQEQEDDEVLETDSPTSAVLDIDELCGDMTTSEAVRLATGAANWSQLYQGLPLGQVTVDSVTLTEVLRLHLLSSGGRAGETSAKWRYQQRGGYTSSDDPGLTLRIKQPHILRSLSVMTICELPLEDKLAVLTCLTNQILTYTTLRDVIEERGDKMKQTKAELRSFQVAEVKRVKEAAALRTKERREAKLKLLKDVPSDPTEQQKVEEPGNVEARKQKLERDMQRKKAEAQKKASDFFTMTMNYQILPLGKDRAHRRFWFFSSLPGLYVEHDPQESGPCLPKPTPSNTLACCDTLTYVKRLFEEEWHNGSSDKENDVSDLDVARPVTSPNKKMLAEKNVPAEQGAGGLSDGKLSPVSFSENTEHVQCESWACTASEACPVHGADQHQWSFFAHEDDVNRLLECLNERGIRESELRSVLSQEQQRIRDSILRCPVHKLDPNQVGEFVEQRKSARNAPSYKPEDTHLNFPPGTPIQAILEQTLRDFILEMEEKINSGGLGKLKVKDHDAWRQAISTNGYDKQCESLVWGGHGKKDGTKSGDSEEEDTKDDSSKDINLEPEIEKDKIKPKNIRSKKKDGQFDEIKDETNQELISKIKNEDNLSVRSPTNIPVVQSKSEECSRPNTPDSDLCYHDPGRLLGEDATLSANDTVPQHPSVKNLASAILQVAQSVDPRYLRKPLGTEDSATAKKEKGLTQLERWEISLMASTSFSQLFLHIYTFDSSILWSKSALYANCRLCRRKGDADKMLLCDGCNKGHHLYCLKPKLIQIPQGDWYCPSCNPEKRVSVKRTRRHFCEDDSDDEARNKEKVIVHHNCCDGCGLGGNLNLCSQCPVVYHTECIVPQPKNPPRGKWTCSECKSGAASGVATTIGLPATPPAQTPASTSTSSLVAREPRIRKKDEEESTSAPARRTSRRSGQGASAKDLPLNNAILQDLLTEIMHHKDAWPFLRPVPKAKVPDYHSIIKRPMDFGTMKYKLNMIEYMNNNEFIADALLVFENCQMYNQVDAVEYKCGLRLSRHFKKRCKDLGLEIQDAIKSQPKRPRLNI